jgi:hypothetical protein
MLAPGSKLDHQLPAFGHSPPRQNSHPGQQTGNRDLKRPGEFRLRMNSRQQAAQKHRCDERQGHPE